MGGTTILSETPEIYGAEHLLTRRAVTPEVGEKLVERIRWWEDYTARNERRDGQQPLPRQQARRADDHPGKVAGRRGQGRHRAPDAASTSSPNRSPTPGFVYMDSPGYDPCSVTGQIASGRQPDRLHHRARLGLGLQAQRPASSWRPTPRCMPACPRTWTSTAATSSPKASRIEAKGRGDPRQDHRRRLGPEDQVRGTGLRRRGIRALADRRGDVRDRKNQ